MISVCTSEELVRFMDLAKVSKYQEPAPNIRFLSLEQIDKQLEALEECPQLQTMVAMYIYAGLRRESLLRVL